MCYKWIAHKIVVQLFDILYISVAVYVQNIIPACPNVKVSAAQRK